MKSEHRRRLFALGASVSSLIATLCVLEALAHLAPRPQTHREPLELDAELGFRGIPGHRARFTDRRGEFEVVFDAEGYRGAPLSTSSDEAQRDPESRRIVFVGDSFLVGLGLRDEDLMTARVEVAMGGAAQVSNLSLIDSGTAQQLLALRAWADRLDPEVVVLALYPGNDVINNSLELAGQTHVSPGDYFRPYLALEEGRLVRRSPHPWRAFFRRRSRLFALVEERILALATAHQLAALMPWPDPPGQIERLRLQRPPEPWLEIFREPPPDSDWDHAWHQTFDLIRILRDEVEARGAELLVLVIPSQAQVERTGRVLALDHQTRRVTHRALDRLLDWNLPETRLARFFAEEGIAARFLLEPLRSAARGGESVYDRDGHLSAEGHAVAARVVVEVLRAISPGEALASKRSGSPEWTQPVDRLQPASSPPGPLDFSREPRVEHLGGGFGSWQSEANGRPGGWWMVGRAMLVLPVAEGRLVVRGWRPADALAASRIRIDLSGVPSQRYRVDAPGPFALELAVPQGTRIPAVDGHVPVILSPLAGGGRFDPPLLIQGAGFER